MPHIASVPPNFTGRFPSAPLTAPVDLSFPRVGNISSSQDYPAAQMSAPIAPPRDFSQALKATVGSSDVKAPPVENLGGPALGPGLRQDLAEGRGDDVGNGKRNFTIPQASEPPSGLSFSTYISSRVFGYT